MEYQKTINLRDNTSNQLSKLIEINDQSRGVYNTNSGIRFKATMLKSVLRDYNNAYKFSKGKITSTGAEDDAASRQTDGRKKGLIFKRCSPFIKCKSEINNTEIDNAKDVDIVMSISWLKIVIII